MMADKEKGLERIHQFTPQSVEQELFPSFNLQQDFRAPINHPTVKTFFIFGGLIDTVERCLIRLESLSFR